MAVIDDELTDIYEPAPESERGAIEGLRSRIPIGPSLPSLYHDDDFCQRLTTVFDDALSPVVTTLDCMPSYFDPSLAPEDFVEWLAGWVGVRLDEAWSPQQRRQLVIDAVDIYRRRGTLGAMHDSLVLYTGEDPDISDSGGCAWSSEPNSPLPGQPLPSLVVRVRSQGTGRLDARILDLIVNENKPAHLHHRVVVVED